MSAVAKKMEDTLAALITEAARKAVKEAKGDQRLAVDILEAAVRKDQRLRDAILDPLLREACSTVVSREIRTERREVWTPTAPTRTESLGRSGASRVVQLAAGNLLMFPLPGGKKLAEATRAEIAEAAGFYDRQAGDMAHKARWLRLVAQSVPAAKTVGDVLTDKRLRELQEAARAE